MLTNFIINYSEWPLTISGQGPGNMPKDWIMYFKSHCNADESATSS